MRVVSLEPYLATLPALLPCREGRLVAAVLGLQSCDPKLLRRNIAVQGINLLALKDKRFQIGTAVLEYTGLCHPCSFMETTFGPGGYNAVRGHGGITAKVLKPGMIELGNDVLALAS